MTGAQADQQGSPVNAVLGARRVAVGVGGAVVLLCLLRLTLDGIQPYGSDGAEYLEHAARLFTLEHVRNTGSWLSPWETLVSSDASFPPLLHLVTLGWGVLFGHSALAAAASGSLWLLALGASVAWCAWSLTFQRSVAFAAFSATLLTPAFHGAAVRYYYDLPMVALLWAAVAVLLSGRQRHPLASGLAAGTLLSGAALVKWAALAFAPPLVLGALLLRGAEPSVSPARRGLCGALALSLVVVVCLAFVHGRPDDNSFHKMSQVAFDSATPVEHENRVGEAVPRSPLGMALGQVGTRAAQLRVADLLFYPLRLVTSVFSPVLAVLLAFLLWRWLRVGRRAWELVACALGGHALFLLGGMPVLDDRFALAAAPALLLAGTVAWSGLPDLLRRRLGAAVVVLGLLVAVDFHFVQPSAGGPEWPWSYEVEVLAPDRDDFPPTRARGLAASSSVEQRGWARHDEQPRSAAGLRQGLWAGVMRCGPGVLGVVSEPSSLEPPLPPLAGPDGDREWLQYRALYAHLVEGGRRVEIVGLCPPDGRISDGAEPDLLLLGRSAAGELLLPHCLDSGAWREARSVIDPEGGSAAAVMSRLGSAPCDG